MPSFLFTVSIRLIRSSILEKAWRRNIDNINTLATEHGKFATKLNHDLVTPFSHYDKTPENGSMGMLERNLTQIGKDMELAESKIHKAEQSKSKNRSAKQSEAHEDMKRARARWESESPNSFMEMLSRAIMCTCRNSSPSSGVCAE